MPQHAREAILDKLVAVLSGIGSGAGWAQTVSPTVNKLKQIALDLTEYPQILVIPGPEALNARANSGPLQMYASRFRVILDCWIEDTDMSAGLSKMLHDVERAIGLDPTLSGVCSDTTIVNVETLLSENLSSLCGIQVEIEVLYGYRADSPSTLG